MKGAKRIARCKISGRVGGSLLIDDSLKIRHSLLSKYVAITILVVSYFILNPSRPVNVEDLARYNDDIKSMQSIFDIISTADGHIDLDPSFDFRNWVCSSAYLLLCEVARQLGLGNQRSR